ncbi:hypothetical protein SAMN02745157_1843 [Kaistia soli DSM 19436]|uniref:Uncharacterized protein n=1 Tax=Kaistia soli DSM 19436 TaxID=1122133 RepID=A0A1M4ZK79_9HYPH|nr:OmpH family outer membrane protein [Kaistia soli]SHF18449.1 hypothetical protein SAMN02745157_1843 [Kaistia soli DSM 19436]
MNIWGLAGAAVIGGVAVASAGVLTGVIEVPYSIQIAPKNPPAPAPEPVAEAPQAQAETPAATPVAQPAKPLPVAQTAAVTPPRPRPRPVTVKPAPSPIPVASAPYQANQPTGDIDYFFDALAPYGQWVADRAYGYVFVPDRRGAGWRPYQEGQWVWTDDYGWYWQSNEPFGWATYHYGRWDYSPAYGWFWVPGDVWSPAWVTFRTGGGSVGWAPVAPDRKGYAYGMPRRYQPPVAESWVFVDQRAFGGADIGRRAVPIDEIGDYLGRAQDVRRPRWQDGRFYNDPVGRPSQPSREIVYVDQQDDIFEDNRSGRIGVFRPQIDDGNFNRRPDRYVNDVPREDRSLIRQFVPQSGSGTDAVSAALLSVLAPAERQTLDDSRQQDGGAWQAEINRLNAEKAALVEQQRQASASRQTEIDAAVKKAEAERQAQQDQLRKEREARAQSVLEKVAAEPKPQPPAGQQPPQPDQPQPPRAEPSTPAEPAPPPPAAPAAPSIPPPPPAPASEPAPASPKPPKRERPVEQPASQPQPPAPAAEAAPQPEAVPPAEQPPARPKRQKPAEQAVPPPEPPAPAAEPESPPQPEAAPPGEAAPQPEPPAPAAEPAPQPEAVPPAEERPARPKRQKPPEQAAPQPEAPPPAAEPTPSPEPPAPAAEPAPQPEPAPPAAEPARQPEPPAPAAEPVPQPEAPAPAAEPAPQPEAAPPVGEAPRGERGGERPNKHRESCPEGMVAQPDGGCAAP